MEFRVRLRALTKEDISKTLKWHNQSDIKKLYSGHPFPVNVEMEQKWYENILTSNFPNTVFVIELIESSKLIGIAALKKISLINRTAEFSIYIGDEENRKKGYSYEATILILRFGFFDLGLNRISLKVQENNKEAIKLYEKCRFIKEGVIRKSVFKKNVFLNEIIMSILKSEFEEFDNGLQSS